MTIPSDLAALGFPSTVADDGLDDRTLAREALERFKNAQGASIDLTQVSDPSGVNC